MTIFMAIGDFHEVLFLAVVIFNITLTVDLLLLTAQKIHMTTLH